MTMKKGSLNNRPNRGAIVSGLTLLLCLTLAGCYQDKSTLATNLIEAPKVNDKELGRDLFVEYLDHLVLEPEIERREGFDFKWEIFTGTDENNLKREVIGTDLKLDYTVDKPQSTTPYRLLLTVTDTRHDGLEYLYTWPLTVQGSILSGLLVAETSDGKTSDLAYIKSPNITAQYDREPKVLRPLLKQTPTGAIKGRVNNLLYTYFGYKGFMSSGTAVWATTEDGQLLQFNHKDFLLQADLATDKLVAYKPTNDLRASQLSLSTKSLFLGTNAGYYWINNLCGATYYRERPVFMVPEELLAGVSMSNGVTGCYPDGNNDAMIVWYDDKQGAIRTILEKNYTPTLGSYAKNEAFDPSNLPDRAAIAIAYTEDGKGARLLLKSKSGVYELYTIIHHVPEKRDWRTKEIIQYEAPATAHKRYAIPSDGQRLLDQAVSVFFAERHQLLYIITPQSVYALTYGLNEVADLQPTPLYTTPAGERLTMGSLLVQGDYAQYKAPMKNKQLKWNGSALILCSQNGSQVGGGTVRVIPIDPEAAASGKLLPDQAETYTGFDEILYVTHIGD